MKSNEMDELRAQIDSTDQQIVELIRKRTKLTEEIGDRKKKEGLPIYRSDRHTAVYHKVGNGIKDPLLRSAIQSIYREIMSLGMAVEGDLRVYCVGDSDAYHTARLAFGTSIHIESCEIQTMLDCVTRDVNSFGFIAATGQAFSNTLDAMFSDSVSIYAEAFSDSANQRPGRYFILSKSEVGSTGDDCTSVAAVPLEGETSQSLGDWIVAKNAKLIDNRTIPLRNVNSGSIGQGHSPNIHYAILDFAGHKDDADIRMILEGIKSKSSFFKVLGSFPRAVSN